MAKHLMFDLETMAVTPRAVVLTLGAVTFDPYTDEIYDDLYLKIDIDDQDKLQRDVDPNTLDWWAKQDAGVMEEAFSSDGRISLEDAVTAFHKFAWGCNKVWSHGSVFDIVIMEDIYRQLNRTPPWNFYDCRDTRTLFDLADPEMEKSATQQHNALFDAIRQAKGVQTVYRKLGKST
jgi:exodeoxyribonuclease VIII